MKKLLAVAVVLIIAALALLMLPKPQAPLTTGVTAAATAEEVSVLEDFYIEMLNEELDALTIEQTAFNSEVEDSIAADVSQFYYE